MTKALEEIAQQLITPQVTQRKTKPVPKVQLIYAFNGTGKTRLSSEVKNIFNSSSTDSEIEDESNQLRDKFLYYNAFTEDLFYWDNDLQANGYPEPKLKIQPNTFTGWLITLLKDLGEDGNIVKNFQRYTSDKVTPEFNEEYKYKQQDNSGDEIDIIVPELSEVTFKVAAKQPTEENESNDDKEAVVEGKYEIIKISKGEESNFVWSIFYTLLDQIVSTLNEPDNSNRITDKFDKLEYVFIDDPVSSLDDTHLIELAVDLAGLIKSSKSDLKFLITTHSPLFYNVLCNELGNKAYEKQADGKHKLSYNANKEFNKYRLVKKADGTFVLLEQPTDSPFSYHLFLLSELQDAIKNGKIRKYHFSFIRNILEKMATFLGYNYWPALLPKTTNDNPDPFANRILNLSSHSAHAGEEVADIEDKDKENLEELVKYLVKTYGFKEQEAQ